MQDGLALGVMVVNAARTQAIETFPGSGFPHEVFVFELLWVNV